MFVVCSCGKALQTARIKRERKRFWRAKPFCGKKSASAIEKSLDSQSDLDSNGMRKLDLDSQIHNVESKRPCRPPSKWHFFGKNSESTFTLEINTPPKPSYQRFSKPGKNQCF